ncbi:hypothetical protein Tco_1578808, partial [Tanacetum coccineum]
ENDRYKTSEGYHIVPLPYTGNFMPPKSDLVLADEDEYVFSELVTSIPAIAISEAKTSASKPKSVGEPLIKDWISDNFMLKNKQSWKECKKEKVIQEEASRATIIKELDSIQDMIEADEQLVARLQAEEQEQFSIEEKSRMLVDVEIFMTP